MAALWSPLDRSTSPIPAALMIRGPYRNHTLVDVEEHALLSILPEYARESLRRPHDADNIVQQLILDSPELWPRTRVNPLRQEEITDVYHWIIRTTARASYSDVDLVVAEGLLEGLEETLRHDRSTLLSISERTSYHRRTQHLFRALADVSHRTRSRRIGDVLVNFFLSHVSHIAATDAADALGQWCFALLRTFVGETRQDEALRRILSERPDLPSRLIGRGRKAEEVLERLEMVLLRGSRREVTPRSRDLFAREYGRDYLSLERRSRSISRHDSPLIRRSSNHSLLGDGDELVRQTERFFEAQEDAAKQGRRMLQLTMGRRYADRFDRREPLGLEALVLGGELPMLPFEEDMPGGI